MNIPTDKKIYDTPLTTLWLDDSGILCSVAKKGVQLTIRDLKIVYATINTLLVGRKVCTLTEMTNISSSDREIKDFVTKENERFTIAMALIATSRSSIIGNFFIGFHKTNYPIKVFSTEIEARDWLKNYL